MSFLVNINCHDLQAKNIVSVSHKSLVLSFYGKISRLAQQVKTGIFIAR